RQNVAGGQPVVHVTTVPALGDGRWGPAIEGDYRFGGNLQHPNVRGFFPADLNGDGRMDLVAVVRDPSLPLGANAIVFSLMSLGNGAWDDRYAMVRLPNEASGSWRPMEVNGDGATDLAYVWTKPGQPLVISSMLSLGDGKLELG